LYDISGDLLKLRKSVELDVAGASTVVSELAGEKVADLLLLNDRDLSYAKLRFDESSVATLKTHLGKLDDALARALCWAAIWDMHRDAEISTADFLEIALNGLAGESDDAIVNIVLAQLQTSVEAYSKESNRVYVPRKACRWTLDTDTKEAHLAAICNCLFLAPLQ
jgi:aminopeptidase N